MANPKPETRNPNSVILGIDLGTTNSLGAYMTPTGPVVIRDATGNGLVPSVIAFAPDGRVTVGSEARCTRSRIR